MPANPCAEASKTLFVLRKPYLGSGITIDQGIEKIAIEKRLEAHGGRRGPISVRAALGPSERMRIDHIAIRFGSIT